MDDKALIGLVNTVLARIRPNRGDSESYEDCWQQGYASGLQALRNAERSGNKPSARYLMLYVQRDVYRYLHKPKVVTFDAVPEPCNRDMAPMHSVDTADYLEARLAVLSLKQRGTILAYYAGESVKDIARKAGVGKSAIHERIKTALRLMRDDVVTDKGNS